MQIQRWRRALGALAGAARVADADTAAMSCTQRWEHLCELGVATDRLRMLGDSFRPVSSSTR